MSEDQKFADIQALARMAARLAGRDPDERIQVKLGDVTAFNDVVWRYPDFLARAALAIALWKARCSFQTPVFDCRRRMSRWVSASRP